MASKRLMVGAAVVALAVTALTACTGSGSGASSSPTSSSSKPVTVDFWGAAIGYDKSVALFNASHKDIQINYTQISAGSAGGYAKMLNAVKAGNAPCLGQVGYDTLSSFAAANALEDVSKFANSSKKLFAPAAWQLSSIGKQVLGIPQDLGPMALYYRTDLFTQYGITPPKTWAEFATDAATVHTKNPAAFLTTLPVDAYDLGALSWQAGAQWFGTANNKWQVKIDGSQTQKVASYWQDLVNKQLVVSEPTFDTAWYKDFQDGRVLSLVGAVWASPLIEQNAPGLSGKLGVVQLPQWTEGKSISGNRGGSSFAVLKGCKTPQQATEAALWMSTSPSSVTNLITNTGIYPAALSGQKLAVLSKKSDFYGGQNVYDVFKKAAANTPSNWVWGPTMSVLQPSFKDGLKQVGAGQGTIPALVTQEQENTVSTMKSQGLSVSG
ncbi:ABC transporter substrate-binding protein [Leifsonia sp. 2MCAF36]|uniref:ABC transporter substrate-binding protein n=1 Tax=Leifsonia sp. 2MCAF36 TaxID=3232988 RepID=UPI003F9628CF